MSSLLADPAGFSISLLIALFMARKAARLLDVRNQTMAIVVAALAAVVGPLLVGDIVTAAFGGANPDDEETFSGFASGLVSFGSPMGFALIGALAWSSWERS